MRKFHYLLVTALLCFTFLSSKANPGDTTWVQANIAQLTGNGNYDSVVTFPAPGKTYRKIYMIFTLGKYMCGGSGYCGDWDYTVQNILMTPTGDTLEIGRLITPYANAGAPCTPWTWQQHYIFDVTEYAGQLKNSALMRIAFSGWTPGFTANIKFAFIEGTPERDVKGVTKLWSGSFGYGGSPDINVHFPSTAETAPAGTAKTDMKFTVTGHGSDANGCCEFMSHNYQVMLNGTSVATKTIWRDDCGANELGPQSGTWIYQRGNWCPGAMVYPNFHTLSGITGGTAFNTALQFDAYTGGGSYTTEGQLIYYSAMNKTLDISLDQIISPTNDENHYRENPISGQPVIHVRNSGSTAITSLDFQYNVKDSATQYYTWTGSLASEQEMDVTMPPMYQLNNLAGSTPLHDFAVKVVSVNGTVDDDTTNNAMTSQFYAAPLWPTPFQIWFKTNNESLVSDTTLCETSWAIYDMYGNVVAHHGHDHFNTLYKDTMSLAPGCYKLVVTDSSCDGLHWWVFDSNPGLGITTGFVIVKKMTGANLPVTGAPYTGTYSADFGCGYTQYFSTGPMVQTAISNVTAGDISIDAFPNPARANVSIDISGLQRVKGTLKIVDALGRVVSTQDCDHPHQQLNVSQLTNGAYTVVFEDDLQGGKQLTTRLVVVN